MQFGIGQPVPRTEDPKFLMGEGQYVDDIRLHNTAYGYVLRSPHAHARIKSIDTAAAKAAPGVLLVLTGRYQSIDLTRMGYQRVIDNKPLEDHGPKA